MATTWIFELLSYLVWIAVHGFLSGSSRVVPNSIVFSNGYLEVTAPGPEDLNHPSVVVTVSIIIGSTTVSQKNQRRRDIHGTYSPPVAGNTSGHTPGHTHPRFEGHTPDPLFPA